MTTFLFEKATASGIPLTKNPLLQHGQEFSLGRLPPAKVLLFERHGRSE
jgi:hypothetical protein